MQSSLFEGSPRLTSKPVSGQLLKWVGNKHRFAEEISCALPEGFGRYVEPFLGSGAVLATIAPHQGIASDTFGPLMEIWFALKEDPIKVKCWYADRWYQMSRGNQREEYERIKANYNASPNGADLLFLCRSCYGGVVRFRMRDGYMSTPVGIHKPIKPDAFAKRVDEWHSRIQGTTFYHQDYTDTISMCESGDLVYCDPPYTYSQAILYGAQAFSLERLFESVADAKSRGVYIALSIDGTKKSGSLDCQLPIPKGLFERELTIDVGRSMLKRFQMGGQTLESEHVSDRLLLTF